MVISDTRAYWNRRYVRGGTSGPGSTDYRDWKWSVMERHAGRIDDVVDVGCGDLSFWAGRHAPVYTGLDFSEYVVEQNRRTWPHARFVCTGAEEHRPGLRARIVMCMDMLFHVMDDDVYRRILENLTQYSSEWIFLYTWTENPFRSWSFRFGYAKRLQLGRLVRSLSGTLNDDGEYQKYRSFTSYLPIFEAAGFTLVAVEKNPSVESFGSMHVFRRLAA